MKTGLLSHLVASSSELLQLFCKFPLQKWHGAGNDFIFVQVELGFQITFGNLFKDVIRVLCHRNQGIGADGVVFWLSHDNETQCLILNSDGSCAASCGNALRCLGALLAEGKVFDLSSGPWKGEFGVGRLRLFKDLGNASFYPLIVDADESLLFPQRSQNKTETFAKIVSVKSANLSRLTGFQVQNAAGLTDQKIASSSSSSSGPNTANPFEPPFGSQLHMLTCLDDLHIVDDFCYQVAVSMTVPSEQTDHKICLKKIDFVDKTSQKNRISFAFIPLANPHLVFCSALFQSFSTQDFKDFGNWVQKQSKFSADWNGELNSPFEHFPVSNIGMLSIDSESPQLPQNTIKLVVFERGAGLTKACGTGAIAASLFLTQKFANHNQQNLRQHTYIFELPGGNLEVQHLFNSGTITECLLVGDASLVAELHLKF